MKVFIKVLTSLLLLLYLLILVKQILIKFLPLQIVIEHLTFNFEGEMYWGNHNFIPFKTISHYLISESDMSLSIRVANLIGNIIGFMPFGFLMPVLSKRFLNLKMIVLSTFCLSLVFELTQLIFRFGNFDVDDLILNTFGGVLGYFVISLIFKFIYQRREL